MGLRIGGGEGASQYFHLINWALSKYVRTDLPTANRTTTTTKMEKMLTRPDDDDWKAQRLCS